MAAHKPNRYIDLILAIMHDNVESVKFILSTGEVNIQTPAVYNGRFTSYLHLVKSLGVARKLLQYGARVDVHDENGKTPLHTIINPKKDPELITEFIRNGAEIDREDFNGWTPLALAVQYKNGSAIVELIRNGADVHKNLKIRVIRQDITPFSLSLLDQAFYSGEVILAGIMLKDLNMRGTVYTKCKKYIDLKREDFRIVYNHCLIEINKMKTVKIKDNLSVYGFLMKFNKHLPLYYLFNRNKLLNKIYLNFDVFAAFIIPRIKLCLERGNILHKVQHLSLSATCTSGIEIILSIDVIEKICEYLSNADLEDLIEASL